jgi:hypothetical protein
MTMKFLTVTDSVGSDKSYFIIEMVSVDSTTNQSISLFISVGYDTTKMLLRGMFSYERENQRTLPFNVDICQLPEAKTIFVGASSEYQPNPFYALPLLAMGEREGV